MVCSQCGALTSLFDVHCRSCGAKLAKRNLKLQVLEANFPLPTIEMPVVKGTTRELPNAGLEVFAAVAGGVADAAFTSPEDARVQRNVSKGVRDELR